MQCTARINRHISTWNPTRRLGRSFQNIRRDGRLTCPAIFQTSGHDRTSETVILFPLSEWLHEMVKCRTSCFVEGDPSSLTIHHQHISTKLVHYNSSRSQFFISLISLSLFHLKQGAPVLFDSFKFRYISYWYLTESFLSKNHPQYLTRLQSLPILDFWC